MTKKVVTLHIPVDSLQAEQINNVRLELPPFAKGELLSFQRDYNLAANQARIEARTNRSLPLFVASFDIAVSDLDIFGPDYTESAAASETYWLNSEEISELNARIQGEIALKKV